MNETEHLPARHASFPTHRVLRGLAVAALLLVLFLQLLAVNRSTSMSWDEGHHLFDGYTILKHHDYALNPEVPPFAKIVAALPLQFMHLHEPVQQGRDSQLEAFLDGKEFLFGNDANSLLLRGRLAISLFTLLLGLLVFFAGQQIFDTNTGLLALAFLAFDPLLLAHGALVTTDAAITSLVFAAVFAWYRYCRHPSPWRLGLTGLVAGLALAVKFTGLFLLPTLVLMVLVEALQHKNLRTTRTIARRCIALLAVFCIAYGVLWSSYGFRYAARPNGQSQNPPLAQYLEQYARVASPRPLQVLARFHALPEAYLWGSPTPGSPKTGMSAISSEKSTDTASCSTSPPPSPSNRPCPFSPFYFLQPSSSSAPPPCAGDGFSSRFRYSSFSVLPCAPT